MEKLLTENSAAEKLGVSPSTLRHWRFNQRGPRWVKLGASRKATVRYRPNDLEAFITQGEVRP